MSFKLGDRVVKMTDALDHYNPNADLTLRGVIQGSSIDNGKVFVKWDGRWNTPPIEEVDLSSLVSEEEANQKISILEQEYDKVFQQVRAKVDSAAELLLEANKLATPTGTNLFEMYEAHRALIRAMDDCGWNTSSFNC